MLAHLRSAEGEAAAPSPQTLAELRARLDRLHPADIAVVLEALPLEERLMAWDLVKADRDGEILLEVSDAVRESLIASMDSRELVAAAETLEADEIADIAMTFPTRSCRTSFARCRRRSASSCARQCPTRRDRSVR
jgi:magnesium transporter